MSTESDVKSPVGTLSGSSSANVLKVGWITYESDSQTQREYDPLSPEDRRTSIPSYSTGLEGHTTSSIGSM